MSEHAVALRPDTAVEKRRSGFKPPVLWRRPPRSGALAELLCLLTGPSGAGKSTLIESLDHPAELACSLPGRKILRAGQPEGAPARREASGATLTLETEPRGFFSRSARQRRLRLRLIETPLAELLAESSLDPRALLLCLPADGLEDLAEREPLLDFVARLADRARTEPRRVVVCLTKYERLFLRAGRDAVWRASTVAEARRTLAWSFGDDGPYGALRPALEAAASHRKVWAQPVSGFGFVAGNGGANVTPDGAERRTRWLAQMAEAKSAGERDWRPFLTHDALILAAEGKTGKLGVEFRALMKRA